MSFTGTLNQFDATLLTSICASLFQQTQAHSQVLLLARYTIRFKSISF